MGSELRRGWPETEIAVWRDYAEYIARMVEHGTAALRERDAEIACLRAALEWYAETARESALSGNIGSMTNAYQALEADAGARARRALDGKEADGE